MKEEEMEYTRDKYLCHGTILRLVHKMMMMIIFTPLILHYLGYSISTVVIVLSVIVALEIIYLGVITANQEFWSFLMNFRR